jgi:hypothetical protein
MQLVWSPTNPESGEEEILLLAIGSHDEVY